MRRFIFILLAPLLLFSTAACFQYVRVPEVPDLGTPVRAHLARPLSFDLSDVTAHGIVRIQGEVVSSRPDRLVLSAFRVQGDNGFDHPVAGETVVVPPDALGWLEEKRFSIGRSALAGVGFVGVGYLLHLALDAAVGGGDGDGPVGPIR